MLPQSTWDADGQSIQKLRAVSRAAPENESAKLAGMPMPHLNRDTTASHLEASRLPPTLTVLWRMRRFRGESPLRLGQLLV
jgi:hypothetical protein